MGDLIVLSPPILESLTHLKIDRLLVYFGPTKHRPGPNKNTKQLLTDGIWWMNTKSVGLFIFNPVLG